MRGGRLRALLERFRRSTFARSASVLSSGQVIAYTISLVSIPLLSRVYTPGQFGSFALIASFSSVAGSLGSLGLQSAVVRAKSDQDSSKVLSVGVALGVTLVSLLVGVVFELRHLLPPDMFAASDISLPLVALFVGLMGVLTLSNSYMNYYANRCSANKVLFANAIIASLSTLLVSLPLGWAGAGTIGLVVGSLVSSVVSLIQMVVRVRPTLVKPGLRNIWYVLQRFRAFVAYQYPANFVEDLTAQLPRQVLGVSQGDAAVGQFSMNERVLSIPMKLLGAPLSTVYLREAAKRRNAGLRIGQFTARIVAAIMAVSVIPVVMLTVWAPDLFGLFLGEEWRTAGTITALLAFPSVLRLTRSAVGTARVVVDKQASNLAFGVLRLLVEGGALLLGVHLGFGLLGIIALYAVASSVFLILDMTVTMAQVGAYWGRYLAITIGYGSAIISLWFFL